MTSYIDRPLRARFRVHVRTMVPPNLHSKWRYRWKPAIIGGTSFRFIIWDTEAFRTRSGQQLLLWWYLDKVVCRPVDWHVGLHADTARHHESLTMIEIPPSVVAGWPTPNLHPKMQGPTLPIVVLLLYTMTILSFNLCLFGKVKIFKNICTEDILSGLMALQ